MTSKEVPTSDIVVTPGNNDQDLRRNSRTSATSSTQNDKTKTTKNTGKSIINFLYNPKDRTVLGRSALGWAKLSAFYSIFYFFLGCFFVLLVSVFASILNLRQPRYYNSESAMALKSPGAVVGMGFRPQPLVESSLIEITNDLTQQTMMASSLLLFRNVFLLQSSDAQVETCSPSATAANLSPGTACAFNWFNIVPDQDHPCSDNNLYGFKYEQPCILLKLNKVYGWRPNLHSSPIHGSKFRNPARNKTALNTDVRIICNGTNVADNDVLTNTTYYSLSHPLGSSKHGIIPNYFFPYRNARDHVQPFVLVQFNKLPLYRLVTVTCYALAPGIENSVRGMRGMVSFQLYRTQKDSKPTIATEDRSS